MIISKIFIYTHLIIFLSVFMSGGCEKNNDGIEMSVNRDTLTLINSFEIYHIHQTNVKARVDIISINHHAIQERGVCWSETNNPSMDDKIIVNTSGQESFIAMLTSLSANTTYYARPYVNFNWGTVYGEEKSFTTTCKPISEECEGTFTDSRDGMEYRWVRIGNQVWMAENLAWLPSVSPPKESSLIYPYYYVFDYFGTDETVATTSQYYVLYGVYYNWKAVMQGATGSSSNPSGVKGCCPEGWHVPSLAEWVTLKDFVAGDGHFGDEGIVLKSTSGWILESGNGTDDYGFTALPGGGRNELNEGAFGSVGENAHWWSSSDDSTPNAWMWDITVNNTAHSFIFGYYTNKNFAFTVRCVGD